MIRIVFPLLLSALALTACKEDLAQAPDPVSLNAEAVGFYCQMNLLEHDGPKAQIHLDGMPAPIFLSQVRDAIAYMRMPEQSHAIVAVYVNDMSRADSWARPGADNWMLIENAVFVLGSRQIGGMGAPEIVPFSNRADADSFAAEHGGQIVALADVTDADVLTPQGSQTDTDESDIANRLRKLSSLQGG